MPDIKVPKTVSPEIGEENHRRLRELAAPHGLKPTTLARLLLIFAIGELEQGRIEVPPHAVVRP